MQEDDNSEQASMTTDDVEAQWYDYGSLPNTIPDFNMALSEFLIKQAGVNESFPATLRHEAGIHSYKQLIRVLERPYTPLIEIMGGKVSLSCEKDIVHCVVLTRFLELPVNSILGADLVPEYTGFPQQTWLDYLANNRKRTTNEFQQALNTHVLYKENSRKEYPRAHGRSKSVSPGGSMTGT
jgi:hypothetical protein